MIDGITLHGGDCRDVLRTLPDNSIDSVVTDPPYALVSIVKRFGSPNAAPAKGNDAYMRASAGFMGKTWDTGETAFSAEFWAEVLRVLKPGGHVAAFGASRGYHRMACAIEDAGFEIRDSLMWIYSTGFPKSHNLERKRGDLICGCDTESSSEREMRHVLDSNVSTTVANSTTSREVLQSSMSQQGASVERAQAPIEGISTSVRIAQPVMERRGLSSGTQGQLRVNEIHSMSAGPFADGTNGRLHNGAPSDYGAPLSPSFVTNRMRASSRSRSKKQPSDESRIMAGQSKSQDGGAWPHCRRCSKPIVPNLGTALKPAFEPIVLARKPLSESTVAANVLRWRTGALNIDGCRIETTEVLKGSSVQNDMRGGKFASGHHPNCGDIPAFRQSALGRWPANVCHDGSDEIVAAFPTTAPGKKNNAPQEQYRANNKNAVYGKSMGGGYHAGFDDQGNGSAVRFFYSAKASKADRAGSKHPTVKPVSLMQWLCRLITPPGGTVLDPFAGSGTTGAAARLEGFRVVLIEREAEYQQDIRNRFATSRDLFEAAE